MDKCADKGARTCSQSLETWQQQQQQVSKDWRYETIQWRKALISSRESSHAFSLISDRTNAPTTYLFIYLFIYLFVRLLSRVLAYLQWLSLQLHARGKQILKFDVWILKFEFWQRAHFFCSPCEALILYENIFIYFVRVRAWSLRFEFKLELKHA